MKIVMIFLLMLSFAQANEETARVVYDLTTSDMAKFEKNILKGIVANKNHYEGHLKELEAVVVIHGGAYRFFVKKIEDTIFKDDVKLSKEYTEFKKRIAILSDTYEVEFLMCKAALPRHKLEAKDIVDFVKIIPNSTMGLIDKQNEGFAYIPVSD